MSRRLLPGAALFALILATAPTIAADRVVLRVGTQLLDTPVPGTTTIARVNFDNTYTTVPAVFVLPDETDPDPATIRVLDVDLSGFDVLVVEPSSEDGATPGTTIEYFAVEPFFDEVDGVRMEARILTGITAEEGRNIPGAGTTGVAFQQTKLATPVVLAQLQTDANGIDDGTPLTPGETARPWMTTLVDNPSTTGFDLAIERSEDSGALSEPETIAYFAIDGNVDLDFLDEDDAAVAGRSTITGDVILGHDNGCVSAPFGRTYAATPRVFGNKQSRDGADGGWLRRCTADNDSVDLVVDEDRIDDADRAHTDEVAGLLTFARDFVANRVAGDPQRPFTGEVGTAIIGAAASDTLVFTRVDFVPAFDAAVTPLVFTLPTESGPEPATVRVKSVTHTGFDVAAIEPPGEPGAHDPMDLTYIAVEPGRHRLDDGRFIQAGSLPTQAFQGQGISGTGTDSFSFPTAFAATPALITQVQTVANEPGLDPSFTSSPFLTSVVLDVSATAVVLALERSETVSGSVVADETIGWLAADSGVHGTLVDQDGATVEYDFSSGAVVQGFGDGCPTVSYTSAFSAPALVVADKNARNGNNGGWLRRCSAPTASGVGLAVEEDRTSDTERNHIDEPTSVFAFERAFTWCPSEPDILVMKSSVVHSDPVTGTATPPVGPKRLPGALVDYTITVTNSDKAATDADTVQIRDALPAGLELFLGGTGSPVDFQDGTPNSGLDFVFTAIDSATDDLEFTLDASADPVDWSYQPPTGVDYDPNIDAFRVRFDGALNGQTGATAPSFRLVYRTRLD